MDAQGMLMDGTARIYRMDYQHVFQFVETGE